MRLASSHHVLRRLYDQVDASDVELSRLALVLRDADVGALHLSGLRWWMGGGVVLALVGGSVVGLVWTVAIAMLLVVVPALTLVRWSGRRQRRIIDAFPEWLDMVGRSLRSGSSFRQALIEAHRTTSGPLADELAPLSTAVTTGAPIAEALVRFAAAVPGPEARLIAASLALASENEAGIGPALVGVNQSLRDRAALRDEVVSLAAQATASMNALLFLPAGFLVFDGLAGGSGLTFLLGRPLGRICLVAGTGLNLAGWVWMRLAIRHRLPA